jgi:drug/metabolite transporter (DMT)-like permease
MLRSPRGYPGAHAILPSVTRAAPLAAQAMAVVVWATTFVLSASALATTSAAVLTVLRFALAAAVLVPLAARRGGLARVLRAPVTAVLGLTGVAAYYGLQNLGLLYTTAGTAALLQAVLPVATAALAVIVLRERMRAGTTAGLVLATAGVVLVASGGAQIDLGAVLVVAGVLGYAVYTVLLRRLGSRPSPRSAAGDGNPEADPVVLAAATALWGLAFLLPWQGWEIATGRAHLPSGISAIIVTLYLGIVASGGTLLLWTYGAARTPASVSGVLTAAIPALGYALAVLTGEQPTASKTAGGILAVAGVLLAAYAATRSPTRRSEPAATSSE